MGCYCEPLGWLTCLACCVKTQCWACGGAGCVKTWFYFKFKGLFSKHSRMWVAGVKQVMLQADGLFRFKPLDCRIFRLIFKFSLLVLLLCCHVLCVVISVFLFCKPWQESGTSFVYMYGTVGNNGQRSFYFKIMRFFQHQVLNYFLYPHFIRVWV